MKFFLLILLGFLFMQENVLCETLPQDSIMIDKLVIVNKALKEAIYKEIELIPKTFRVPSITTILVSIIEKEEKVYDVFISTPSSKINRCKILYWHSMLTPYRYQQFVGLAKFQGYDIFIFGNQTTEFYKIKGNTYLPEYFNWIQNLSKMKFSNPFFNKEGKTMIHFDPFNNRYGYKKRKFILDREYDPFDYIFDED